jgi:hypothetical protein
VAADLEGQEKAKRKGRFRYVEDDYGDSKARLGNKWVSGDSLGLLWTWFNWDRAGSTGTADNLIGMAREILGIEAAQGVWRGGAALDV